MDIINSVPADCVQKSLSGYARGELDRIVIRTIRGMRKKIRTQDGNPDYAPLTRQTFWNDWCAIYYGSGGDQQLRHVSFRQTGMSEKPPKKEIIITQDEPSSSSHLHNEFISACEKQNAIEAQELAPEFNILSQTEKINDELGF